MREWLLRLRSELEAAFGIIRRLNKEVKTYHKSSVELALRALEGKLSHIELSGSGIKERVVA